jgi:hypothetical protein
VLKPGRLKSLVINHVYIAWPLRLGEAFNTTMMYFLPLHGYMI